LYYIDGLKFSSIGSAPGDPGSGLRAELGGWVIVNNAEFGVCLQYSMLASSHATLQINGPIRIDNNAVSAFSSYAGGLCACNPVNYPVLIFTGTPAFPGGFASSVQGSLTQVAFTSVTGGCTGPRYNASGNSIVDSFGHATTYLPGDSAGLLTTGGQYT
jgi:hypothetical protein